MRVRHALAAIGLVGLVAGGALAATPQAERGGSWLASRQTTDGDLPGYTGSGVGELVLALLAAGQTGEPVDRALRYIESHPEAARSAAHAARLVMALRAAGEPIRFADLFEADDTGAYDPSVYGHALAMVGAVAAGLTVPDDAVRYLRANQCLDGGFSWRQACAAPSDTDTTAMAISALVATGLDPDDTTVGNARGWLMARQNTDGGWGLEADDATNANSTGLALSAIAALDEDPTHAPWTDGDRDPRRALLALQHSDGGFRFTPDREPGDYATIQAVLGLTGTAYPPPRFQRSTSPPPSSTAQPGTTQTTEPISTPTTPSAGGSTTARPAGAPPEDPEPRTAPTASGNPWPAFAVVAVLLAAGGGFVLWRRR